MLSDDTHFCLAICLYPLRMETANEKLAETEAKRILNGKTAISSISEAIVQLRKGLEDMDCVIQTFDFLSDQPDQVKRYLQAIMHCLERKRVNSEYLR